MSHQEGLSNENLSEEWNDIPENLKHSERSVQGRTSELQLGLDKLDYFIEDLSPLYKDSQLRSDILQHCGDHNLGSLNSEKVRKVAHLRVQKMIRNKRIKKNWGEDDIRILMWIVSKYVQKHQIPQVERLSHSDWKLISSMISGVTVEVCMFKWLGLKKTKLATNNWMECQEKFLRDVVLEMGTKCWKNVSQEVYRRNTNENKIFRNPKQCRQHWICYLNPKLRKGPWRHEQDVILMKAIKNLNGSKKWSQVVGYFDGRTENALKNRFNLLVDKQRKFINNESVKEIDLINYFLEKSNIQQFITMSPNLDDLQRQYSRGQEVSDPQSQHSIKNEQSYKSSEAVIREGLPLTVTQINFDLMRQKGQAFFSRLIPAVISNNQILMNIEYRE